MDSVHDGRRNLNEIPFEDASSAMGRPGMPEQKLRVLMVNTVPMIYDGITRTILNYALNMNRDNLQLDLLTINSVEDSIRKAVEGSGSRLFEIHGRNQKQLRYALKLAGLIRRNHYEVVHIHGNSCTMAVELVAAWLGGAKVRCPHSHNTRTDHPRIHKLLRPVFDTLLTQGFACGMDAGRWLYQNDRFIVLNNGTNTDQYSFRREEREACRRELNLDGKIAVGHVAHFTYHKNHPFLIDVFADVVKKDPRYVLVLVGDGIFQQDIQNKVKELGIGKNVIFVGTTTRIPEILAAMDFMVLPSLYEGLPNVVIEGQCSGLPVLAADTITTECKLSELVRFLPLDRGTWVNAILNCDFSKDRSQASAAAIKTVRENNYDIKMEAQKLKRYYRKLASQ